MAQRLPGHADRPKDDLDREQRAAESEPIRKDLDAVAIGVEIGLESKAGGAVGLGDILHVLVVALGEQRGPAEREYQLVRQQDPDRAGETQDERPERKDRQDVK
jgi:hypothetical protein